MRDWPPIRGGPSRYPAIPTPPSRPPRRVSLLPLPGRGPWSWLRDAGWVRDVIPLSPLGGNQLPPAPSPASLGLLLLRVVAEQASPPAGESGCWKPAARGREAQRPPREPSFAVFPQSPDATRPPAEVAPPPSRQAPSSAAVPSRRATAAPGATGKAGRPSAYPTPRRRPWRALGPPEPCAACPGRRCSWDAAQPDGRTGRYGPLRGRMDLFPPLRRGLLARVLHVLTSRAPCPTSPLSPRPSPSLVVVK